MNYSRIPCYVLDKRTGARVEFNASVPEDINESYVPSYDETVTKGRSSPFKAYSHSGPRSVSFTVVLSLDYNRDLLTKVTTLRNMMKPSKSTVVTGPKMHVRIGNVIDMECVPTEFSCTWREGYKDGVYRVCDISFGFDEIEGVCTFAGGSGANAVATVTGDSIVSTAQ